MLVLFVALLLVFPVPTAIAILLARSRPRWSYFKAGLVAAAPMPLVLTIGSLLWFGVDALGILFATLPMFVFGTMGGVVGAWMMPRPQAPLINPDEIENIFG